MEGGLWQHYIPMVDGETEYEDNGNFIKHTAKNANNYNIFYKVYDLELPPPPDASIMKIVLNSDPSTIKTFNTLNYEGSQAYVIKPTSATPTPTDSGVTLNNVQAWQNGSDIDGWNCTKIKTDMDTGSVVEFIKKEGKWFNYIKGKTVNPNQDLDTSRFSVQGIGVASSVITVTI